MLRRIDKLKKANTLQRIGNEKTGYWKINETDQRSILLLKQITVNPEITINQLSKTLKISKSTTLRAIEKLKIINKLLRIGDEKTGYCKVIK